LLERLNITLVFIRPFSIIDMVIFIIKTMTC